MPRSVVIAVTAAPACRLIAGQVRLLAARGWDVHVVVGENVDESVHPTAKVHVLPMRRSPAPGADGLALASWIQLLREIRPAVVVGATPKAGLLSLLAAAATRVPHRVWWVWGLRSEAGGGRAVRLSEHTTARASTSIVAASPSLIDVIPSGRAPKPLVLGFGSVAGVDLRAFAPAASPDSGQTSTSPEALDPTQPRALTVAFLGRLAADKGIPDLARIWPQVSARVPAAQLLLAGAVVRSTSKTAGSSTYRPITAKLLGASSAGGFSTRPVTRTTCGSSVGSTAAHPYDEIFAAGTSISSSTDPPNRPRAAIISGSTGVRSSMRSSPRSTANGSWPTC